jgi:hypothetical protein
MITLENNALTVRFPEVHKDAVCTISFQRTLRIPDDNRTHGLPPGLGNFPLFHVDDYASRLPAEWSKHGGIFLPMHQAEAMWIRFSSRYPFAVKIAAGKINAVTGEKWTPELRGPRSAPIIAHDLLARGYEDGYCGSGFDSKSILGYPKMPGMNLPRPATPPQPDQDYLSIPSQPWLDGFCVEKGKVRQFVATKLGDGYTVEEQITGEALHGGLQIIVYPLRPEFYTPPSHFLRCMSIAGACAEAASFSGAVGASMGLAPGGLMRQTIHEDDYGIEKWDQSKSARCFVHLLNSSQFKAVTDRDPPLAPITAAQYSQYGLPWFDYYDENAVALKGSDTLKKLDSVAALSNKKGEQVLPENEPVVNPVIKTIVVKKDNKVRQGEF